MKLGDYIKRLQVFEEVLGGDLLVIYSEDDEGNSFRKIEYEPNIGTFVDGEFIQNPSMNINCVCVN